MREILKTTQLEFDKSGFLIDLVKHTSGAKYVEIVQRIYAGPGSDAAIKINPAVLPELIKVLQSYEKELTVTSGNSPKALEDDKQKIVSRYLKGVGIKDLVLQFDESEKNIEMILRNAGIVVEEKDVLKKKKKRWYKK